MFDTLVVDCEGALYYILKDSPEILANINLIITENDYPNDEHFEYVIELFRQNGLELVYNNNLGERTHFYQVWKK